MPRSVQHPGAAGHVELVAVVEQLDFLRRDRSQPTIANQVQAKSPETRSPQVWQHVNRTGLTALGARVAQRLLIPAMN